MAYRPIALVVEDDELQRAAAAVLLEDNEMEVFQCGSGEAAQLILDEIGGSIRFMFTDASLAGSVTGADLAHIAASKYPKLRVVVTSGRDQPSLPTGIKFIPKPWNSLDVLREANEACSDLDNSIDEGPNRTAKDRGS